MRGKDSLVAEKLAIEQALGQFLWNIYRSLGIGIAGLLKNTGLKPNHITWFSFVFGLVSSGFFFFQPNYFGFLTGSIFLLLSIIFDYTDGSLARMNEQVSHYGWYLDQVLDDFNELFFILSLSVGLHRLTGDYRVWICGILIYASDHFGELAMTRFKTIFLGETATGIGNLQNIIDHNSIIYRLGRNVTPVWLWRATLIIPFALLDQMLLFFVIFSVYGSMIALALTLFVGRKIKNKGKKET